MYKINRKTNIILKMMNMSLVDMPIPKNISILWNTGILLGVCMIFQIMTGIFLSLHYNCNIELAFDSVSHICRDTFFGWFFRNLHANGASLFFIFIYLHIARGIYYQSYYMKEVWNIGWILLMILMATSFLGYVLPWGQMSFWGATVITNLLSVIPYVGTMLVEWLWGGFSIGGATLTRFFSFHFMLPFLMIMMVIFHVLMLHVYGSSSPLKNMISFEKMYFHPYFTYKDILIIFLVMIFFMSMIGFYPLLLSDPENFNFANPLITPIHIQPEWYFLFAYAILRSIPNKLGGVVSLLMSVMILLLLSFMKSNKSWNFFLKINLFWIFIIVFILLTWIGARSVEAPYILVGQILTMFYFLIFFLFML
uniref:Cytochrome b n=1 Tax=Bathynella cf. rufa JHS-2017 TaxID=2029186 RepID=A0A7R6D8S6_9CRUS|nr:cytochrome b [Bathynella cf. rufa JHS-2017]